MLPLLLAAAGTLAAQYTHCRGLADRIDPSSVACLSRLADEAQRAGDREVEAYARYQICAVEPYFGDYERGRREVERARELFAALPDSVESRRSAGMLGFFLRDLGEPRRSLELIGESIAREAAAGDRVDLAVAHAFRARTLLWMGELEEAEAEARVSVALAEKTGDPYAIALAYWPLGVALDEQGRVAEAVLAEETSGKAAALAGNPLLGLTPRYNVAEFSLERGDLARAERELDLLERDPIVAVVPPTQSSVFGLRGQLLALRGRYREALPWFDRKLVFDSPWTRRDALLQKARALRALHDPQALPTYRTLVAFLDEHRERAGEQQRASFLAANATPYRELVAALFEDAGEASAAEAFAVAERGRARALVDAALGARSPQGATVAVPLPLHEVQELLAPGEALLEYSESDEGVFGFALTRTTLAVRKLVAREEVAGLRERIALFAALVETEPAVAAIAPGAAALHALLVAPLLRALPEAPLALAISADGALHGLPFAALLPSETSRAFLGTALPLRELPSASFLGAGEHGAAEPEGGGDGAARGGAGTARAHGSRGALVVGDPLARAGEPLQASLLRAGFGALPQSAGEARTAAATLGAGTLLLLGAEASEARVKAEAPGRRVLHFATHGFSDEHLPLRSALVLRQGDGEDGLLEAQEIMKLDLGADLVVLSGCSTGAGRLRPAEGVQSLSRAFLLAGARSVVSTRWAVPDGGARTLIEDFYAELGRGADTAAALSRARALQLARGAPPRDWTGFSLVGARRLGAALPISRGSARWPWALAGLGAVALFALRRRWPWASR